MALQIAAFHSLSDKGVGGAVNGQDLPLCPGGGGVGGGTGKGTWGLVTWETPALQGHGHQWASPHLPSSSPAAPSAQLQGGL